MGVLTSRLFTEGDPATVKKLEDCAVGRPREVLSHFKHGHSGEHIRRVQQALKDVRQREPGLGIPDFEVNGVYDSAFADAVSVYKEKRNIRNYANKIDNIVGIKTIRSLDSEATKRPRVDPPVKPKAPGEFPRPLPNCVPDAECPVSREFDITLLFGMSGGEIAEVSRFWFTIRDTTHGLSTIYLLKGLGLGIGSPVSGANGGAAKPFRTDMPVRVTRFGQAAVFGSGTNPLPPIVGVTVLTLQFRPDKGGLSTTRPLVIDAGDINIPGGTLQGATFSVWLPKCRGGDGAARRPLGRSDLVFS